MSKKKLLIILNPKAGRGLGKNIREIAADVIDENVFEITIGETKYAHHATLLAKEAVQDHFSIVACMGGDGTVNETAKSLVNTAVSLAIVPTGSGNGLARHLSIPCHVKKSMAIINDFKVASIDTFRVNDLFAVNVAGVGFDAYVAHKFAEGRSRGFVNYIRCVAKSYGRYPSFSFDCTLNEDIDKHAWLISFANSSQFGNNAYVAPYANCADGVLDITICKKITPLELPLFVWMLFNKKLRESKNVSFLNTTDADFTFPQSLPLHIDGEPAGVVSSVHVKLFPGSLQVIVP